MIDQNSQSQPVQIVPATIDDLHEAAALRAAMSVEMGNDWDLDHPGWRDRFIQYFGKKQAAGLGQFFYARTGERVIGIAAVSLVDDYHSYALGRHSGRVNAVYVIPDNRRKGVAKLLMKTAMDWLQMKGCVVVRLNASEDGQKLYSSLGFKMRREMEFYF